MQLSDTEHSNDEMAFGLIPDSFLDTKTRLRNLLTFVIRQCVFNSRHLVFSSQSGAITALKNKIKFKLKCILEDKHAHYKYLRSETEFKNLFLVDEILGKIENNKLILTFSDL